MFLIVEGPTAAGKSTLIKHLAAEVGDHESAHMGQPAELNRRWVLKEYVNKWQRRKPRSGHLIADRWHFGEVAYAPIYRPETDKDGFGLLGRAGWRWTEMFLASRGATIIMLTSDNDSLVKRLEARGDDHVKNVDDLLRISSLYELARRDSVNVAAIHDTSELGDEDDEAAQARYAEFITSAVEEAKRREDAAHKIVGRWNRYVGPLNPQVLLVGDTRNLGKDNKYAKETILPFMPVDNNSAEFLINSLPEHFWRTVGMINGAEVKEIPRLWKALGQPRVVALGNNARDALKAQNMDAFELPHPAWVSRFKHSQQKTYGEAIMQVGATGKAELEWTQSDK